MDDALGVDVLEAEGGLPHDLDAPALDALRVRAGQVRQGAAGEELHDDVVPAVLPDGLDGADDVAVLEPERAGPLPVLVQLAGELVGDLAGVVGEDLDGHLLARLDVRPAIEGGEPALGDLLDDPVVAVRLRPRQRQGRTEKPLPEPHVPAPCSVASLCQEEPPAL